MRIYTPEKGERQLSLRSILLGCLLGCFITIINAYFGLRTGWGVSGGLISAIFGYAIFSNLPLKHKYTVLENNMTETAGSAASLMVTSIGVISIFPALKMLGHPLSIQAMYAWSFAVAFLGVFFAVPLRRKMIVIEKLRFPSGTAAAHTIVSLHAKTKDSIKQARVLIYVSLLAAAYTFAAHYFPFLSKPHVFELIGLTSIGVYGFYLLVSPMLFGAGIIIGFRIGMSLLMGALVAWGLLAPWVNASGWVTGPIMSYTNGTAGWILWPGVTLLVVEVLMNFLMGIIRMFQRFKVPTPVLKDKAETAVPLSWWMGGLLLASLLAVITLKIYFNIPVYQTLLAIVLASVLSAVAAWAMGETEINPISVAGKLNQLVFGALAPGQIITNLMAGGVAAAGAGSAGDMLQDWKTGYLLGASIRAQFIAQLIGTFAGVIFSIPVYVLFDKAYQIGQGDLPAPAAHTWYAMAELLSKGWQILPPHVGNAMIVAGVIGVVFPLLRLHQRFTSWIPSGLAIGIAFIVPPYYSIIMAAGSIALLIWQRVSPSSAQRFSFITASGMIVGEGLMGAFVALLTIFDSGSKTFSTKSNASSAVAHTGTSVLLNSLKTACSLKSLTCSRI